MNRISRALVHRSGRPLAVETITVAGPGPGEATIRMAACGACHSDLSAMNGTVKMPAPLIPGHEGAGTVIEVGEGVTDLKPGDLVLTSFIRMCGRCAACVSGHPVRCELAGRSFASLPDGSVRTHDQDGQPLNVFYGIGAMSEYATIHADNAIRIDDTGIPMASAAIVSCAVLTGVGAVSNTARLEPGSTVAVFGLGGVGLSAVQGARIAGAARVIAVDANAAKGPLALEFGATDFIDAAVENVIARIRSLGGIDYGFECAGSGALVSQAYKCLAPGGTLVVVGVAPGGEEASFKPLAMMMGEHCIRGSLYGSARPRHDIPRLLRLYHAGRLKLDELVTRTYSIAEAAQAYADLERGVNARGVVVFDA